MSSLSYCISKQEKGSPATAFDRWLKNKANPAPGDRKTKDIEWLGDSVSEKIIAEIASIFN